MPEQDVIYLTKDFEPVEEDDPKMVMVKVRMPDGKIVFGFPEGKAKQNKLFHMGGRGSGFSGHSGRPGRVGGSSKFLSSVNKRTDTMQNPFDPRVTAFLNDVGDDVKANVELSDYTSHMGEAAVYFNITVPQDNRGKGYGSEVMKELMSEADKAGVLLVGDPEAFGQGKKMSTKQLWGWYQSLGFKKEGRQVMYRPAKTLKITIGKFHE